MKKLFLYIAPLFVLTSCSAYLDSWKAKPGQRIASLPVREYVIGSSLSVSVQIIEGNFQPFCMVPDAANEIGCIFYYGYLENGMVMNPDGYRYLGLGTARQACSDATWFLGTAGPAVVNACARALLTFRWTTDIERYVPKENQ